MAGCVKEQLEKSIGCLNPPKYFLFSAQILCLRSTQCSFRHFFFTPFNLLNTVLSKLPTSNFSRCEEPKNPGDKFLSKNCFAPSLGAILLNILNSRRYVLVIDGSCNTFNSKYLGKLKKLLFVLYFFYIQNF